VILVEEQFAEVIGEEVAVAIISIVDNLLHRNRPPRESVNLSPPMFYFQLFSRIFCCFYY